MEIRTESIKDFWEKNPLCAKEIPFELGTKEYFQYFDQLREKIEPFRFAESFYEFNNFAGKKVLDAGCGNGWVLSHYARGGADVYGVDLTKTGVELCEKRFRMGNLKGNFAVASAEKLPYPDNYFDGVSCVGVVHHTAHPAVAVSEIHRVLKPGGRLAFMVYHRNSFLYRVKFPLLSVLTRKSLQQLVNEVDGAGNPRGDVYSKKQLRDLLSNFTVNLFSGSLQGWMLFPKLGRLVPDRWLKPFERIAGWFLYAKATKS